MASPISKNNNTLPNSSAAPTNNAPNGYNRWSFKQIPSNLYSIVARIGNAVSSVLASIANFFKSVYERLFTSKTNVTPKASEIIPIAEARRVANEVPVATKVEKIGDQEPSLETDLIVAEEAHPIEETSSTENSELFTRGTYQPQNQGRFPIANKIYMSSVGISQIILTMANQELNKVAKNLNSFIQKGSFWALASSILSQQARIGN